MNETKLNLNSLHNPDPENPSPAFAEIQEAHSNRFPWAKLTKTLRWTGGIALAFSAFSFLINGTSGMEQLPRFFYFLGMTTLLTSSGLFCVMRWKDDKGARTFMALATALIPALFAQLGAFVFASLAETLMFEGELQIFSMTALSATNLIIACVSTFSILIPVSYFGFAAMVRPSAKTFTSLFIFQNSLLLLPFRSPNTIAAICFANLMLLLWLDRKHLSHKSHLKSWDGIAMRALLFAPTLVIAVRSALLHNVTMLFHSVSWAAAAAFIFVVTPRLIRNTKIAAFTQGLSMLPIAASAICIATAIDNHFPRLHNEHIAFLAITVFSSALFALSFYALKSGNTYRNIASSLTFSFLAIQSLAFGNHAYSFGCLALGMGSILVATKLQTKSLLYIGIASSTFGLCYQLKLAANLYQSEYMWVALGIIGISTILTSSFLEKRSNVIKANAIRIRSKIADWN